MMNNIWILLVIFQFKHFIADYLLQGKYMLGKFKDKGWVLPLASHCGVHFLFTTLISLLAGVSLKVSLLLAFLDFTIHFIMDRIKASSKMLGRYQALSKEEFLQYGEDHLLSYHNGIYKTNKQIRKENTYFWYSLGLDQMVHHLTDILIIYLIMSFI